MNGAIKTYPDIDREKIFELISHIFIHIYGIYPTTHLAKNQIEAMESAGLEIPDSDMKKVTSQGIMMLLDGFEKENIENKHRHPGC